MRAGCRSFGLLSSISSRIHCLPLDLSLLKIEEAFSQSRLHTEKHATQQGTGSASMSLAEISGLRTETACEEAARPLGTAICQ